ncbi:uncharacterized protein LOC131857546 [Cryptomeria japonica]|uniref:uncharacterized protein LOC131857546 n=1 Tax=Cryptomeria japonica TaxID=3369 RepID=UPI0027DA7986|nr:uncharacterized protein LOC131857546 [Cryptomeria japonica]
MADFLGKAAFMGSKLAIKQADKHPKPLAKSGLPEVTNIYDPVSGLVVISVPDKLVDLTVAGKWTQAIKYESLPFACFHCKKLSHWAKSCPLKKSKESKTDSNVKYKKKWQTIEKKGDPLVECDPEKEEMEPENEVKKGENSNNEKHDCVCSNNQIERTKEGEQVRELNNKNDPEDQEVDSVSQEKEEESPNDLMPASSDSKSIEENFNEAQEFNPSNIEPLLLLTNGNPKLLQCKTPSHSVEMDILEGNLRILEETGKDGSEMDTDESEGDDNWKDEDVGAEDEEGENEFYNDSPIHNASPGNDNSQPMMDNLEKNEKRKDEKRKDYDRDQIK